jgi:hypothetical protein
VNNLCDSVTLWWHQPCYYVWCCQFIFSHSVASTLSTLYTDGSDTAGAILILLPGGDCSRFWHSVVMLRLHPFDCVWCCHFMFTQSPFFSFLMKKWGQVEGTRPLVSFSIWLGALSFWQEDCPNQHEMIQYLLAIEGAFKPWTMCFMTNNVHVNQAIAYSIPYRCWIGGQDHKGPSKITKNVMKFMA